MASDSVTIAEQVRKHLHRFTTTERKAAHVLLATYPLAGLEPVAEFAARAGVSAPTILRFVARLGIGGYPEFQRLLRDELEARLRSPLMKPSLESAPNAAAAGGLDRFRAALADNLEQTFAHIPPGEFDAVVDLVTNSRRALYLIGGRFTDAVARYMAAHLRIVRPGVVHMAGQVENLRDQVLDMRRGDTLVVFDVRRYQEDIVALSRGAAGRGAKVVLITDQWLSPISRVAAHTLSAHISVPSNWDSNASVMALAEALLAAATERLGASAQTRIAEIERIRTSE